MKIGILTFQPSLNYGGILQCAALKATLEQMGHEVSVFRRWSQSVGGVVDGPYVQWGKRQWLRFAVRSAFGLGDSRKWLRYHHTQQFLSEMNVMPWKLSSWEDTPADLDLDLIVVGSDQVWHCGDWGNPAPFLLEGAPTIPAIAYAASFGMTAIPQRLDKGVFTGEDIPARYRADLSRFKAISCREAEGVRICECLGLAAVHVVDPTMLRPLPQPVSNKKELLVCYLLTYSPQELLTNVAQLEAYARKTGVKVQVFLREGVSQNLPSASLPLSPRRVWRWLRHIRKRMLSRVDVRVDAGPAEFLDTVRKARWMVTDSFHGLMFAIRNRCDVRVLRPTNNYRATMFARIEEFAEHFNGPMLAFSMDAALASIEHEERVSFDYAWLEQWRADSLVWLKKAVEGSGL